MRRQPVAFFLGDAAFLSDSKFRALARRLPDPDDFNSAVGAFFIALAHARRNGVPDIDLTAETSSSFLQDLIAVGLLTEAGFPPDPFKHWAPTSPQQVAGKARALSAERDSTGRFAPSDAGEVIQRAGDAGSAGPASPPLRSIQLVSTEREGVQGEREDIEAFLLVRRRLPTVGQQRILDEVLEHHDITGPAWAADVILHHPQDPIGALLVADKAWRAERIDAAIAAESQPKLRRKPGLRDPLLQELAELNRAYYAEKGSS